jgi:hypothetical protein
MGEFLNKLLEQEKNYVTDKSSLKLLEDFSKQVEEYAGGDLTCDVTLGSINAYGQEVCVIRCPKLSYAETLFRVYTSLDGKKVCFHPPLKELEEGVDLYERLMKFIDDGNVVQTLVHIRSYRDYGDHD